MKTKTNEMRLIFNKCMLILALMCINHLISKDVNAQYYTGPIATSFGGAGLASTEVEEGIFLNPAILAHSQGFTSGYFYTDGDESSLKSKTTYGLTLIDNTEEIIIPGGFGYLKQKIRLDNGQSAEEQFFQFSVGNFLAKYLSWGFSLNHKQTNLDDSNFKSWSGTLGLLYAPNPNLGIAASYQNFSEQSSDDLQSVFKEQPKYGLGMVYLFKEFFKFRFDLNRLEHVPVNQSGFKYMGGVETMLNSLFSIRIGGSVEDGVENDKISLGFSFLGPRLKLDYTYQKGMNHGKEQMHSVDFRIPLW